MWCSAIGCIVTLILGILITPLTSGAQPPEKTYRLGILAPQAWPPFEAFRQQLHDLGYAERHNLVLEHRWAEGRYERLPELAAELVQLPVDVIVTWTTPAALAAQRATATIPISRFREV